MAKIKLPEQLQDWKVTAQRTDENGNEVYSVVKADGGSSVQGKLVRVVMDGELYNGDNAQYLREEAGFVKSVAAIDGLSNYLDAAVSDDSEAQRLELFVLSEDLPTLADKLGNEAFDEARVVDFGLKMSDILAKLEDNKMYHGNLKPSNIYLTPDGGYRVGGFLELENDPDDASFLSPELHNGEQADFTTDTYSLGLMMYAMSNGGKLPLEDKEGAADAARDRLSGASFGAPAEGSQKLKSVIVIACQSDNKNRWKNAGNLKNALTAIKSELPAAAAEPAPAAPIAPAAPVIPPESTDFDSNVFEDVDYDDFEEITPDEPIQKSAAAATVVFPAVAPQTAVQKPEIKKPEVVKPVLQAPESPAEPDPEIDNRVFDDYELQTKVFSIDDAQKAAESGGEKDYGDFFEDYDEAGASAQPAEVPEQTSGTYDSNAFYRGEDDDAEDVGGSRKGMIIGIILGVAALLALLAVFGVFAVKNNLFGGGNSSGGEEQTTVAILTDPATTAAPTTAAPTTVPATTAPAQTVTNVVGWGYYYAKDVLEAQGYNVELASYEYSDLYDAGYVITQTPAGDTALDKGATVSLTVSLGSENSQSSESESSSSVSTSEMASKSNASSSKTSSKASSSKASSKASSSKATSSSKASSSSSSAPEPVFSSFKNNTSYLSQSEVKAMSDSELQLALNEIYARRGYIFTSPKTDAYFRSQSWYTPALTPDEFFNVVTWNQYEKANIDMLTKERADRAR